MIYFAKFSVYKNLAFLSDCTNLSKKWSTWRSWLLPETMRGYLSCPYLLNRANFLSLIHSHFEWMWFFYFFIFVQWTTASVSCMQDSQQAAELMVWASDLKEKEWTFIKINKLLKPISAKAKSFLLFWSVMVQNTWLGLSACGGSRNKVDLEIIISNFR